MVYILLIVLTRNIYYLMMIRNDKISNALCGGEISETNEECHSEMTMLLLIDSVSGWLVEIYCAYVLYVYSNQPIDENDDDYD